MRKELGNIKEPTDFEGTVKELAEQVLDLSTKQPDGMIHDADTILADIMETADFQVSGISDDILKLLTPPARLFPECSAQSWLDYDADAYNQQINILKKTKTVIDCLELK